MGTPGAETSTPGSSSDNTSLFMDLHGINAKFKHGGFPPTDVSPKFRRGQLASSPEFFVLA
ncbi:MAG: hypothetical protein A2289_08540 [Deltaproteobacteria bacterium RIFOXYA12_FULL_58_15]|nr:MAG: hypothetical protein A2289_08540 [Deltaproteobacteria bacterium RIFOXYA12_FULL_58_15]